MICELEEGYEKFGKKAQMVKLLSEIIKDEKNVKIPESLVITSDFYDSIKDINLKSDLEKIISTSILPYIRKKFGNKPLVVRSSASSEDNIAFSAAGQYESFLNINTDDQIILAIKNIYESFNAENTKVYARVSNFNLNNEKMSILIQALAPVNKSGVLFTKNPVSKIDEIIIESTSGLGDKVVSGGTEVNTLFISKNEDLYKYDNKIERLINIARKIEKAVGYPIDMEWGMNDNEIYIFQIRPIIFCKQSRPIEKNKSKYYLISKGITLGKVVSLDNFEENSIVYLDKNMITDDIDKVIKSKGFIIKSGGYLSHFANIVREFNKPAIIIHKDLNLIGEYCVLDAYRNKIVQLNLLNNNLIKEYLLEYMIDLAEKYNSNSDKVYGILNVKKTNNLRKKNIDFSIDDLLKEIYSKGIILKELNENIYEYDYRNSEKDVIKDSNIEITFYENYSSFQIIKSDSKFLENIKVEIIFENLEQVESYAKKLGLTLISKRKVKILKFYYNDCEFNILFLGNGEICINVNGKSIDEINNSIRDFDSMNNKEFI